ncbi:MAG: sulfoxide reductase heme-binding subunit YedZ [Rhodocyclaceae bacterium]|nr:sulfoxide reductase heme-binding subunit YedZ [Rhodocyclaceae bacterium]
MAVLLLRYRLDHLGVNPIEALIAESGQWAILALIGSLAITPAKHALMRVCTRVGYRFGRRASDWNWLIRLRRPLGLSAFLWAAFHAGAYFVLEVEGEWAWLLEDLRDKRHLAIGVATFFGLLPLALTSTNAAKKRLGKRWKPLHRLVYPMSILAVLHIDLQAKPGDPLAWPYAAAVALLLGYRIVVRLATGRGQLERDGELAADRARSPCRGATTENATAAICHPKKPGHPIFKTTRCL